MTFFDINIFIFWIGISEVNAENHNNVSLIWDILQMYKFKGSMAADLKIANILLGLMSHASSFPCTWCTEHKDTLHNCGN